MRIESELTSDDMSSDSENIGLEINGLLSALNDDIQSSILSESQHLKIKMKKLHADAVIPNYSKLGDAGMDLTITRIIAENSYDITYGFGIALEIPKGYVGLVFPRSSIRKMDLLLTNSVGVIDSGYRGEIQATFKKSEGVDTNYYKVGERAAQIMILPYPAVEFIESDDLSSTERGSGGFGSTGA